MCRRTLYWKNVIEMSSGLNATEKERIKLLRECLEEMARREEQGKTRSRWEENNCYERTGMSLIEVERKRREGQRI